MPAPPVLLLDEPLGALDPISRAELQTELLRVFHELRKSVLLVTHDVREAFVFGTTITLLNEGRVVQEGTFADLARRPADPYVAQFLRVFFSSRRRHTRFDCGWSSDVCSSD